MYLRLIIAGLFVDETTVSKRQTNHQQGKEKSAEVF
jgi:hypothetical protein